MKKTLFRFLAVLFIITAALAITSCSQWDDPYDEFNAEGKTVSVKYLANGGIINSGADALVDVFAAEGSSSISLVAPESTLRGKSQCTLSHKSDYKFAGWYIAEPSLDSNGNELDADGNIASESGKDPAYTAGKLWNFDTDKIALDPDKDYSANEPVLTLIAMWIPKFDFEFYKKNADGEWALISTVQSISVEIPKWSNGKINMMGFPEVSGMTFKAAYTDEAMTAPITGTSISGRIDYEHGVAAESTVRIYTEWYEGTWYMIENAAQLYSNAKTDGNYMLLCDIDMSGELWPTIFSQRAFTGKIYGNGYKISNIAASQVGANAYKLSSYGLFGTIASTAEFVDLTLENISFTVNGALNQASFGLLAGQIQSGATFENFTISTGELIISEKLFTDFLANLVNDKFEIGLLSGSGIVEVNASNITCRHASDDSEIEIVISDEGNISFIIPDEAE